MIEDLRQKAAWVAGQADFVAIHHDKIAAYTEEILAKYPLITQVSEDHFTSAASPSKMAAYYLALDSVNFGSGYFGIAQKCGIRLEYDVIAKGLKYAFMQDAMNTPEKWAQATAAQCHDLFSIPPGKSAEIDALMALFAQHLKATGAMIESFYDGDVINILEEASGSAVKLVEILEEWPSFRDVADYKGHKIPFLKRAQIFAADIQLAFEGKGLGAFHDMDRLTIFADNMVPHVLRCDGILEYDAGLAARVDDGKMIEAGSAEETELRACAIHAVERMKEAAHKAGRGVTSVNLDHILWNRGYEPGINARPSHKTMTVWY